MQYNPDVYLTAGRQGERPKTLGRMAAGDFHATGGGGGGAPPHSDYGDMVSSSCFTEDSAPRARDRHMLMSSAAPLARSNEWGQSPSSAHQQAHGASPARHGAAHTPHPTHSAYGASPSWGNGTPHHQSGHHGGGNTNGGYNTGGYNNGGYGSGGHASQARGQGGHGGHGGHPFDDDDYDFDEYGRPIPGRLPRADGRSPRRRPPPPPPMADNEQYLEYGAYVRETYPTANLTRDGDFVQIAPSAMLSGASGVGWGSSSSVGGGGGGGAGPAHGGAYGTPGMHSQWGGGGGGGSGAGMGYAHGAPSSQSRSLPVSPGGLPAGGGGGGGGGGDGGFGSPAASGVSSRPRPSRYGPDLSGGYGGAAGAAGGGGATRGAGGGGTWDPAGGGMKGKGKGFAGGGAKGGKGEKGKGGKAYVFERGVPWGNHAVPASGSSTVYRINK